MKGYIHNYTGTGKGKTTASLGLVLRALGAGLNVCIIQFLKNGEFSEIKALKKMKTLFPDQLEYSQSGIERELFSDMTKKDRIAARHGEELFFHYLDENKFDMYILDELNLAVHYGLLDAGHIVNKIKSLNDHGEIIITGRNAPEEFLQAADLITEMKKLKHYSDNGVDARTGIEM